MADEPGRSFVAKSGSCAVTVIGGALITMRKVKANHLAPTGVRHAAKTGKSDECAAWPVLIGAPNSGGARLIRPKKLLVARAGAGYPMWVWNVERKMSILELSSKDSLYAFDEKQCVEAGAALHEQYVAASPFPHIVLDDFISKDVLRRVGEEFPDSTGHDFFHRAQENLKFQYHPQECSPFIRNLFAELNSQAFLKFLSAMTGIKGLIADPYYLGGGLHEIKRGGHLGVHADFNVHNKMKVQRRLNLLIYLNDEWLDSYGGCLELWDTEMKACEKRVAPLLGRAVLFNTDLDSFHGHPDPLSCPENRSRRSIATYYYTAPEHGVASLPDRTTVFKARPKSADNVDWYGKARHFAKDWTPPAVQRLISVAKVKARS
jgi:Rps23 Pro-64 3,4-dihydroxylase Tpa1-like proline 4-hydroxylase